MIYKLNECVYLTKDKYTFKEQLFLNNNNILVYCFVAVKNGVVDCLLQSLYNGFKKDEKDKAISKYLKNKQKLISFDYAKAKPIIEITNYKISNNQH